MMDQRNALTTRRATGQPTSQATSPVTRRTLSLLVAVVLLAAATPGVASDLLARHARLASSLDANPFGVSMHVESRQQKHANEGEVIGVLDAPYAQVRAMALSSAGWCAVATLHPNVKACVEVEMQTGCGLDLYVGKRRFQRPDEAHRTRFAFRADEHRGRALDVRLEAREGPYGTRDYRLALEAAPLDDHRTVVRLRYGYVAGFEARVASGLYFATAGREKVGFTTVDAVGGQALVGGVRGAIERNAVRYFLALQAHLASDATLEDRLARWVALRDRFPRQLETHDGREYLEAKRREQEAERDLRERAGAGCAASSRHAAAPRRGAHAAPRG